MGQLGFFDVSNRYASLDARKDPLVQIAAVVPFEEFRSRLEAVWRKPWDAVVMLKAIILCELYNPFRRAGRVSGSRSSFLIDASIVPVPKQRNKREENATIKAGDTPEAWKEKPARLRRKDCDTRWTRRKTAKAITATRTTSTSTAVTSWCVTMT